jgi:hypothetical protein
VKEGGYSKKVDIKTTIIAFVINYLFFYITVSLYLSYYYGYDFFNLYMLFLSLAITSLSLWLNVRFYFFYRFNNKGVKMRKLSENEIKQVSGGDGNDGQAELIAIGAIAGTFLSPGIGSIAGAYVQWSLALEWRSAL